MESGPKPLPNISEFKELGHIPYFLAATLLIEVVLIFLTRYFPEKVGGDSLNEWYDRFGLEAVIADIFIIVIGLLATQYLYSAYIAPTYGWNPLLFVAVLVGVQLVHDLIFYHGVIKPIPQGHNDMMDLFKKYAAENGGLILLGDALLVIGSAGATFALESMPPYAAAGIAVLAMYTLPYILSTKAQVLVSVPSKKEEAKKEEPPARQATPWDMLKPQVQNHNPVQAERKSQWLSEQSGGQDQMFSPYSLL
jgi:hypothetical protein